MGRESVFADLVSVMSGRNARTTAGGIKLGAGNLATLTAIRMPTRFARNATHRSATRHKGT